MECSICLCAVDATTSSVRTSCGHTFHFNCLATWSKTKTTCPMCRQAFTESETPDWTFDDSSIPRPGTTSYFSGTDSFDGADRVIPSNWFRQQIFPLTTPRFRSLLQGSGWRQNFARDMLRRGSSRQWRRALETHLQTLYNEHPLGSVPQGDLNPIEVEFVMEMTQVTQRRAEAYLRFFRDPVETVVCLTCPMDEDPIPDFREHERPPLEEPYVSRWTGNREHTGFHYTNRDGYESA